MSHFQLVDKNVNKSKIQIIFDEDLIPSPLF